MNRISKTSSAMACAMILTAATSQAVPTTVQVVETPDCDVLPLPTIALVDELGLMPPFPIDEAISAMAIPTQQSACPASDNPAAPNALVRIVNLSPIFYTDLYYVADPNNAAGGTSISNLDGLINGGQAFRIDTVGMNMPLVTESFFPDGVFDPGESWVFIIDDYMNTFGLPPGALNSIGVGFASGGPPSSGSIIATPVPEPGAIGIAAIVGTGLMARRRRFRKGAGMCAASLLVASIAGLSFTSDARAVLGGFDTSEGYIQPFPRDVWMYDAGQTGTLFPPSGYNTGRWKELFGSGMAGTDSQYISQHGYGSGGAAMPPFALAVRCISPSTDGSYNQALSYDTGVDDLGISPTTPLLSAKVEFDMCPGQTVRQSDNFPDNTFNDVPAFSLSFGGTNAAPGVTIGFTDHHPSNNKADFFHFNGATYVSQTAPWTGRFDHVVVLMNYVTGMFSVTVTPDFNLTTTDFDPGNAPVVMTAASLFTNSVSLLDEMYFRTHTDPSDGTTIAGLEKSFLDNFSFMVVPVPEPTSAALLLPVAAMTLRRQRRAVHH